MLVRSPLPPELPCPLGLVMPLWVQSPQCRRGHIFLNISSSTLLGGRFVRSQSIPGLRPHKWVPAHPSIARMPMSLLYVVPTGLVMLPWV